MSDKYQAPFETDFLLRRILLAWAEVNKHMNLLRMLRGELTPLQYVDSLIVTEKKEIKDRTGFIAEMKSKLETDPIYITGKFSGENTHHQLDSINMQENLIKEAEKEIIRLKEIRERVRVNEL